MDDKVQNPVNPIPSQPAVAQPPQGTAPAPNAVQPPTPAKESGDNNKMMMWFIGGLVLVILIVGGIYLYLNGQQQKTLAPSPSPKAAAEENLEKDLDAVNVEDIEGEFTTVDKDLQNL